MDICFLINQLAPGGAPRLLLDIAKYVEDKREYSITVCYVEGDDALATAFRDVGASVVSFNADFKFDPRALYRLYRFFSSNSFDIVHAHLPYSQILARLGTLNGDSTTILSTQHDFPRRYHPVTRTLERLTRGRDDATIAVSKAVEQSFRDQSPLFGKPATWETIYNGVDVSSFAKAVEQTDERALRDSHGIPQTADVILSVGRFTPPKAQSDLIHSMETVRSTHPNAHLVLVGWGPLRDELKSLVESRELTDRVSIVGPADPVEPYYAIGDVFALSSVSESFGIVLVEAMAAGLPVVSTDIPGANEVVKNGETGYLVSPSSPSELAEAISRVFKSDEPYGTRGYERALSTFDIERTAELHLSLYEELC